MKKYEVELQFCRCIKAENKKEAIEKFIHENNINRHLEQYCSIRDFNKLYQRAKQRKLKIF